MNQALTDRPLDLWGLPRRRVGIYAIFAAVLLASALIPLAVVQEGPVICLFRNLTSHPCPGCGLTRSFVAMADFRLAEAFGYHLFGPLLFAALLIAVVGRILTRRSRVCLFPEGLVNTGALRALLAAWLLWALIRLGVSIWGG